ncbi:MAG: isoprenylcysteine carboxylmethyltransferase family protein [Desulfobacteraceae bacterium]
MNWAVAKAILILPGTGVVLIPAVLLWVSQNTRFAADTSDPKQMAFWVGLCAVVLGLVLLIWTISLFARLGRGTLAPWEPTKRLVVSGPYRHARNPMITGVLFIVLGEALLFESWPIGIWMVLFFITNAIYFPFVEEKDLERRFGEEYALYRKNVPRWIPQFRPWDKPRQNNSGSP